jgi:hypothetical protein
METAAEVVTKVVPYGVPIHGSNSNGDINHVFDVTNHNGPLVFDYTYADIGHNLTFEDGPRYIEHIKVGDSYVGNEIIIPHYANIEVINHQNEVRIRRVPSEYFPESPLGISVIH